MKIPRISKSVFKDQLIWMLIGGMLMGGVFPLFLQLLGVPAEYVSTPKFYAATITAGLLMGLLNFGLVHFVTRPALTQLVEKMEKVRHSLEN